MPSLECGMHVFWVECANEEDLVGSRTDVAILSILMLKDPLDGSTYSETFTVQSLGGELFRNYLPVFTTTQEILFGKQRNKTF